MSTSYHSTAYNTADLLTQIRAQRETIARLSWNEQLDMLNSAGLHEAIRNLPDDTTYTVVFADIDRLKVLNSATGNHIKSNRYLAAGLKVREGEIAGQLLGDEIVFIIAEHSEHGRRDEYSADAFVARIQRQLGGQPLLISERYVLAKAQGCAVEQAKLSATFSTMTEVKAGDIEQAIEWLSSDVLRLKAERDQKVSA